MCNDCLKSSAAMTVRALDFSYAHGHPKENCQQSGRTPGAASREKIFSTRLTISYRQIL